MEMSEELLSQLWEEMDWKATQEKLARLQARLTLATFRQDKKEIENLQKRIVRDIDIKCLAVRHVVSSSSTPGIDSVRRRTRNASLSPG